MRSPNLHSPQLVLTDDFRQKPYLKELLSWQDRILKRAPTTLKTDEVGDRVDIRYKYIIDRIISIVAPLFFDEKRIQSLRWALVLIARIAVKSRYKHNSFDQASKEVHQLINEFLYADTTMEIKGYDCTEENWKNRKTFNSLIIYFLWLVFNGLDFKFSYNPSTLDAEEYERYFKEVDYSRLLCQRIEEKVFNIVINNLSVILVPNDLDFDGDALGLGLQISWCVQPSTSPSAL